MARDLYQNTAAQADGSGNLKALSGVQVYVYVADTTNLATIYAAKTGPTQGPTSGSGATGTNPLTTGASGLIEFYADPGAYDIRVVDTQVPARVADRTFAWHSLPASAGGIPSSVIAADGGLGLNALGTDVIRQIIPIGQVIEWWRPTNTVPIPAGFEICDGRVIAAANHDFGTGASITLPDLRNKMVLGADTPDTPVNYRTTAGGRDSNLSGSYSGDGSAAATGDGAAPGIRGAGGNWAKDLRHTHNVPAHYHGRGTLAVSGATTGVSIQNGGYHNHTGASLYNASSIANDGSIGVQGGVNFTLYRAGANVVVDYGGTHSHAVTDPGHAHSTSGNIGNTGGSNGDAAFATDNGTSQSAQDFKGQYVGLLRLMKVRRA